MTELVLLRHGETAWSADKRIQGRTDVPLSDRAVAVLARKRLPDACAGHHVVSSPLVRCTGTARALGIADFATDARLVEMAWGEWEGRRLPELRAELGAAMQANEDRGWDFRPPGGESPREVFARVAPWLRAVAERGAPTVAVCHRGVIRVVLAQATGWDMLGRAPVKPDWDCLQRFELDAAGVPRLVRANVPLAERASLREGDRE